MKTLKILMICLLSCYSALMAQNVETKTMSDQNDPKMDWWKEARFGMFIHWGVFAVPAGVWNGKPIEGRAGIPNYSEWAMFNAQIPCAEYKALAQKFTASKYDPAAFVKLAKDAGMKYIVITTKHHDGFAMFDTKASDFNIVKATPFAKDAIKMLADECKKQGMKLGFYYSQAQDWNNGGSVGLAGMGNNAPPAWDKSQTQEMDTYVDNIVLPQLKELLTGYGDDIPAIIFWDTPRGMNKERAEKINKLVHELKPNVICNNRLGGGVRGDLKTPEQFVPALGYPGEYWETCMTNNESWGYNAVDNNWKSTSALLRIISEIVSKGGNFLLNVGPDAEGVIPAPAVKILKEIGAWMKVNGEAVYGTEKSPFAYLPWGYCTQKGNKLFLHVARWPSDRKLKIPVDGKTEKVYTLVDKTNIPYKKIGGYTCLTLPQKAPDSVISVIVMEIKGEIKSSIADPIPSKGKKVTTSSIDENIKKIPSSFLDGYSNVAWKPAEGQTTGWIMIDLDKPVSVGAFSLGEKGGNVTEYQFEYKDGNNWKVLKAGQKIGNSITVPIEPVKAQFFRLNITSAKKCPEITEFQLFSYE